MAKRPQISDDLHELVHTIHKEYTQEQASGFESALKTVTQLAEAQILKKRIRTQAGIQGNTCLKSLTDFQTRTRRLIVEFWLVYRWI